MTDTSLYSNLIMPQAIGLVVTYHNKINLCPVNWQVVSTKYEKPMTVCIGLGLDHYTLEAIEITKEFVFAYPSQTQLEDSLYCGTVSGKETDKAKQTAFEFETPRVLQTPLVKGAVLNLECALHQKIQMENYSIVLGVVRAVHESTLGSLNKIYSFGNQTYGIIEKVKIMQRGRAFK